LIFNFIETRRPQLNHINLAPTIPYTDAPAHVKFGYKEKGQNRFNIQNGKFSVRKKITTFFSGLSKLIFGCTQPVLIACMHTKQ
jgi:hypothetical protein